MRVPVVRIVLFPVVVLGTILLWFLEVMRFERYRGPTRMFVWIANVFVSWLLMLEEDEEPFSANQLYRRLKQEARIAHGVYDADYEAWLQLRKRLGYKEDDLRGKKGHE